MTVHSFSTQYNTEQFWQSSLLPPDKHHSSAVAYWRGAETANESALIFMWRNFYVVNYLLTTYLLLQFLFTLHILCVNNIDKLMQQLQHVWHGMDQSPTDTLTMQLMSAVDIFEHMFRKMMDSFSNYMTISLHHITRNVLFLSNMILF